MFETTIPANPVSGGGGRMRRLAITALIAVTVLALPAAASAQGDRMALDCGGEIGTIERTNGASWWSQGDGHIGAAYVARSLRVQVGDGGEIVFEKDYGRRAGLESVICEATHEDDDGIVYGWTIDLAPVG